MQSQIEISQMKFQKKEKMKPVFLSKTKIELYQFHLMNEIKISKIINKIPYYANNFEIIINYSLIQIGEMSEKVLQKHENVLTTQNNDKCLLIEYNSEIPNSNFDLFLFYLPTPKLIIYHSLNSYYHILNSFIQLNENRICFFDLSTENIDFNTHYNPLLKNFKNSLLLDNLNESYIEKIVSKVKDFTLKPIEIHLLFYLVINKETLNHDLIETICERYTSIEVLSFFSQEYQETYKSACKTFLTKYLGMSKSQIIENILTYHNTWDNYSLSMLYLYVLGNISRVFILKGTIMNKITILLSKNIHPDPVKRENLTDTKKKIDKLYDECIDWSFVNKISQEKMEKLYDIFIKN
jgi:hypothetical protein